MTVREIQAKTILRKQRRVDSWFVSAAGMNLYRGCAHDCAYCDGRAEKYRVEGEFGRDVAAKINAPELLRRELDPRRKRIPLDRAYILLGGGVGDSYQPAEARLELARAALLEIERRSLPVHVLTKSTLAERDFDIVERIAGKAQAIVSTSLSSADDDVSAIFEPGCAPPSERLAMLARARSRGIATGVYLMPALPLITDTEDVLASTISAIARAGVGFVLFGGMTLKDGRQKRHLLALLEQRYPELVAPYRRLYTGDRWGNANPDYYEKVNQLFGRLAREQGIPRRMPSRLFRDILGDEDRVAVVLENLDYLCRLEDRPSPFRGAARSIRALEQPLAAMRGRLRDLPGVGPFTEKLIEEILDTGSCAYHEELL
jgi:DNA repair photolyase